MRPELRDLWGTILLAEDLGGSSRSHPRSDGPDPPSIPRDLDRQGVSFGVGRVPGEDALTFQVHFKISSTGEDEGGPVTEDMWMDAAKAAAPAGCTVKSLAPTADGGRKASYDCK